MKQLPLFKKDPSESRSEHGGDIRKGRRKKTRPFSHHHPIHVVMRSHRAQGSWSLLTRQNKQRAMALIELCRKKYRIRVYRSVNVGNHLHLLVKAEAKKYESARKDFQNFLRQLAGQLAFQVTGARKTQGQGGFWEKLAYSRLITWGREYQILKKYFYKNFLESQAWGSSTARVTAWTTKASDPLQI